MSHGLNTDETLMGSTAANISVFHLCFIRG
jgi:hypothetical protein